MHHIRHAAAKLFQQLGLRDIARISGFVVPTPGWDRKYVITDDGPIPTLIDGDENIINALYEEEAKVRRRHEMQYTQEHTTAEWGGCLILSIWVFCVARYKSPRLLNVVYLALCS